MNKEASVKASKKPSGKAVKLPDVWERYIDRPTNEQLELLGKAIYHLYKMLFQEDSVGSSNLVYNGIPICPLNSDGEPFDLKLLFEMIVNVYAIL